ncbi:unnamed protein product [Coregonus sp. 'balchen']|nr:unnamed protein product [Coregonus sp. 'balchen']
MECRSGETAGNQVQRLRLERGGLRQDVNLSPLTSRVITPRKMSSCHRQLRLPGGPWRKLKYFYSASGFHSRLFCSSGPETPLRSTRRSLPYGSATHFTPETMHVEPLILERKPEERKGPLITPLLKASQAPQSALVTVEQLFEPTQQGGTEQDLNVLLYGAVGTGKITVVRKLVLDWCAGLTLTQFKLLVSFSCKDLSQLSKSTSLRDLVSR